jgi:site-specific DNA-cytosine methylase
MGAGLTGSRSGTFLPFWKLIQALAKEGRAPRIVVLENVPGAITSHQGEDFRYLIGVLAQEGYLAGALVMDSVRFVPHSRPRLFIVGAHEEAALASQLGGSAAVWLGVVREKNASAYRAHFGGRGLEVKHVGKRSVDHLSGQTESKTGPSDCHSDQRPPRATSELMYEGSP